MIYRAAIRCSMGEWLGAFTRLNSSILFRQSFGRELTSDCLSSCLRAPLAAVALSQEKAFPGLSGKPFVLALVGASACFK